MAFSLSLWIARQYVARTKSIRDVQRMSFRLYKRRRALWSAGETLLYSDLEDRVLRLASALHKNGLGKGKHLFSWLPDGRSQLETRLAAIELGAIATSLGPMHGTKQVRAAMDIVKPELLLADTDLCQRGSAEFEDKLGASPLLFVDGHAGTDALIQNELPHRSKDALGRDDVMSLGFTSGTTGKPKPLFVTHGTYLNSLLLTMRHIVTRRPSGKDTILSGIPLTGAGSGVVLPALLSGSMLVIPTGTDAESIARCIAEQNVKRLFVTPSQLIDLLDVENFDLSSLQQIIYGTAAMPVPKLEEAIRRFGPVFQQGYGLAEVLPPISLLSPSDHGSQQLPASRNVLRSSGHIVPGVDLHVSDEEGHQCKPGEIGELWLKSPTMFNGYWQRPDLNAKVLRDGFLLTYDHGYVDADGRLYVLDRAQDLLERAGNPIYPRLVEEVAHDHPALREACLVKDPKNAQHVLCISLRKAYAGQETGKLVEEIKALLTAGLADWQLPDRILVLDQIPRSYLAKVLRREVRDWLAAEPGKKEQRDERQ